MQAVAARLAEERRLFYVAVTRARLHLLATAVRSDDQQPSRFLDELVPSERDERPLTRVPRGLDLPSVVAELRAVVTNPEPAEPAEPAGRRAAAAAAQLARLAAAGVPGADPRDWYGLAPLSDERGLVDDGELVRLSPSRLEAFARCPLRWLLESAGGTSGDSTSQGIGMLVHALAQQVADEGVPGDEVAAQLQERLASAIRRVDLGSGWFAVRQRERAAEDGPQARRVAAHEHACLRRSRAGLRGHDRPRRAEGPGRPSRAGRRRSIVRRRPEDREAPADEGRASTTHAQLGAYQLAVEYGGIRRRHRRRCTRRAVRSSCSSVPSTVRAYTTQLQDPLADSGRPELGARHGRAVRAGMAATSSRRSTNDMCRSCPVRTSCPVQDEGRQVTA